MAETVLRLERRPLSARAILASAYRLGQVPIHLHGKTQNKTLGARISEDIIERRDESIFFRTKPGRFFLREFLTDDSISEENRQPIATRRRVREIMRGPALAFDIDDLKRIATAHTPISQEKILGLLRSNRYRYDNPKDSQLTSVFVWSFVLVRRSRELLTYRLGRYRDDRDTFMMRRSIGFSTLVHSNQRTLFSLDDFGMVETGVHAAKTDLAIPKVRAMKVGPPEAHLRHFLWVSRGVDQSDLLAIIDFECPNWFHPERRRLALNDLNWIDVRTPINNANDFEPWSRAVISLQECDLLSTGQ